MVWSNRLHRVVDARNDAAHPGRRDIELDLTLTYLAYVVGVLDKIKDRQALQDVEKIRRTLADKKLNEG